MEHIIVDGYNIINDWDNLQRIAKSNLEDARWKLLQILSNYQGYTKKKITVVFDAHLVKKSLEIVEYYDNIQVVFTKENESADNYIERLVHNIDHRKIIVKVATSDYLEQTIILSKGAYRLSARELYNEIIRVEKLNKNKRKKVQSKQTLESRISKDTLKMLEKLRRQKF